MKRRASAIWRGTREDGEGSLTSVSKVLNNTPYSSHSRISKRGSKAGTNPEELIAAAHAGYYSMVLGFLLGDEGFVPKEIKTEAVLSVGMVSDPFLINSIHLDVIGNVPDIKPDKFFELAEKARVLCPLTEALKAIKITMTAKLEEAPVVKKNGKFTSAL